jgi:hypothetical protein
MLFATIRDDRRYIEGLSSASCHINFDDGISGQKMKQRIRTENAPAYQNNSTEKKNTKTSMEFIRGQCREKSLAQRSFQGWHVIFSYILTIISIAKRLKIFHDIQQASEGEWGWFAAAD